MRALLVALWKDVLNILSKKKKKANHKIFYIVGHIFLKERKRHVHWCVHPCILMYLFFNDCITHRKVWGHMFNLLTGCLPIGEKTMFYLMHVCTFKNLKYKYYLFIYYYFF